MSTVSWLRALHALTPALGSKLMKHCEKLTIGLVEGERNDASVLVLEVPSQR